MKYSKKHPKANLENYSKLFVQLGLVLTLGIVYLLIQNKTFTNEIIVLDNSTIVNSLETASNVEYQIEFIVKIDANTVKNLTGFTCTNLSQANVKLS